MTDTTNLMDVVALVTCLVSVPIFCVNASNSFEKGDVYMLSIHICLAAFMLFQTLNYYEKVIG